MLFPELPQPLHQADLPGGGMGVLPPSPVISICGKNRPCARVFLAVLLRSKGKKGCNFAPDAL